MEALKRWIVVLAKNLGLTIVLAVAIILFAVFSDGLLEGLIAALSALIAYTCGQLLFKEYKATPAKPAARSKKSK